MILHIQYMWKEIRGDVVCYSHHKASRLPGAIGYGNDRSSHIPATKIVDEND